MILTRSVWFWCCISFALVLSSDTKKLVDEDHITSVLGLEKLLSTESFLLKKLELYIDSMTLQLDRLRKEMVEIETEHMIAANGLEEYLTNPLNAYRLIQRLHTDWRSYAVSIEVEDSHQIFLDAFDLAHANFSFPNENDLEGSAIAIVRLQDAYKLNVSQIASGTINGVKFSSPMSWEDCFQLGKQLYFMNYFNHTIPWMKESYLRLLVKDDYNSSNTIEVLEEMAFYHFQMGDFKTAMGMLDKIFELEPGYVIDLKQYLDIIIQEGRRAFVQPVNLRKYLSTMIGQRRDEKVTPIDTNTKLLFRNTKEFQIYQELCRGESKPDPKEDRGLRCMFTHRSVPYRFLMPFKMEEINHDPPIVVFHDVISDKEIKPIKKMAKTTMAPSQINSPNDNSSIKSTYRTSQNCWLEYDSLPSAVMFSQRLGDITELNMEDNEQLQVANYIFGGHYEPHFDFFRSDPEKDGNRIATAIFYLSDVEQGGATVFPFLKRAVRPIKGSMVFWYNLHKSEAKDYRTMHAGCPVLKGSKWVANVWIRSRKQMFKRPCGLHQDEELSRPHLSYFDNVSFL